MNLWLVDNNAVIAAETEREAYDLYLGQACTDFEYGQIQSRGTIKEIGEAHVSQLPGSLLDAR